jgi:Ca-activated chloride channel family protein
MTSPRHKILERVAPLLLTLLAAGPANAFDMTKSADDYFHGGAMSYLTNNIPQALNVVSNGLNQYPDNEKLKKLEALLKQQQQQQQNEQTQQQQDQQQDQQQQNQDQQNQQQPSKPDQEKEQPNQDQPQQNSGKPEDQQNAQTQQSGADQPQEMTPEQALRLLDSTKGDESVLPLQKVQPPANRPFKDW